MANIQLTGSREALHRKGKSYTDTVADYLKVQNFIPFSDAEINGQIADLKFIAPKITVTGFLVEGKADEKWVECKNSEISLKNREFLLELGKYFLSYMNRNPTKRFDLLIFVKKEKNRSYWDEVFDVYKQKKDTKEELRLNIQKYLPDNLREIFISYSYVDFDNFLNSTDVYEANLKTLENEIEYIKKHKYELNIDPDLLSESIEKTEGTDILMSNVLRIKEFPEKIWIADLKSDMSSEKIWNLLYGDAYFYENKLYSILPFDEDNFASRFHDEKSTKILYANKVSLMNFEWIRIYKFLIKNYLINRGLNLGCVYDKRLNCIYFKHLNLKKNTQKMRTYYKTSRVVSRVYKDKKTNKVNFVRHDGVKINVVFMDGNFYVLLNYVRLFTEDGTIVITGERAKKLHYKFPRLWMFNDVEKRIFQFWLDFLRIGQDIYVHSIKTEKYLKEDYFVFTKPLIVESQVKFNYFKSYIPDEDLEVEITKDLFDYFQEEEEDNVY